MQSSRGGVERARRREPHGVQAQALRWLLQPVGRLSSRQRGGFTWAWVAGRPSPCFEPTRQFLPAGTCVLPAPGPVPKLQWFLPALPSHSFNPRCFCFLAFDCVAAIK